MSFWQGKKVLITGHTGFKGSWLALWLQSLDAEVFGLALEPFTSPNLFSLAKVADNMTSVIGDIRNADVVARVINQFKPEFIFHLAAQPLVRYSYQYPVETYATNVMGTVHVLEAARQVGSVRAILNVTTDKCYENKEWHWGYRENDRLGGYDPYSNSKACAELVTSAYRSSFYDQMSVGIASARAGNVIGGGDWAVDRLVPDIMRACIHQLPIELRYPKAIRPWQHVLEPLQGYLLLAEKLYQTPALYAEAWNFGPNEHDAKTVAWVADYLTAHWNESINWVAAATQGVHEAGYLKLDCAKAGARLGWKPHWNLERGLLETITWYRGFESGADMRALTLRQIKQFVSETINNRSIA